MAQPSDVEDAITPDRRLYGDAAAWRRQRDDLWPTSWHLYPHGPPPEAGRAHPWVLLPGVLDEPLLMLAGEEEVRVVSNVCTHRGHLVALEPQSSKTLRCRYHGRRFSPEGRCLGATGFSDDPAFPRARDHLPRLPSAQWGPLVFLGIAPRGAPPIDDLQRRWAHLPWDRLRYDPEGVRHHEIAAHWALYCDNYLEGFHIPFVHRALAKTVEMSSYRTECFPWGTLQWAEAAPGQPHLETPAGHPDHDRRIAAYYAFLFPCTMLNVYPWGLSVNVVLPQGPMQTAVRYQAWVWDAALRGDGAGRDLDRVEEEDQAVVRATQAGVRSRLYRGGRYCPGHEDGVRHFHQLLRSTS